MSAPKNLDPEIPRVLPRGADGAHLFQGITDATMSHGEGWQYIQLGRYVERTDTLASLIGAHFKRTCRHLAGSGRRRRRISGMDRPVCARARPSKPIAKRIPPRFVPCSVAEFLLLNPEFPALRALFRRPRQHGAARDRRPHRAPRENADAHRRQACAHNSAFSQIEEIMADGAHAYLRKYPQRVRPDLTPRSGTFISTTRSSRT